LPHGQLNEASLLARCRLPSGCCLLSGCDDNALLISGRQGFADLVDQPY
jgi:hypothetical protein